MNGENVSGNESQQLDGNTEEPVAKKSSGGLAPTAKFVDNKRKLLEKIYRQTKEIKSIYILLRRT